MVLSRCSWTILSNSTENTYASSRYQMFDDNEDCTIRFEQRFLESWSEPVVRQAWVQRKSSRKVVFVGDGACGKTAVILTATHGRLLDSDLIASGQLSRNDLRAVREGC